MRDPKRILKKLIGPDTDIAPFDATGEPLQQAVETFRDVGQCRKIRDFVKTNFGIDFALSPETFYQLLEIGAINYIETTQRDLEVEKNITSTGWLGYQGQCWGVKLGAGKESGDTTFIVAVRLVGLGSAGSW